MPKVSKVGRFRASASSRNVKASPLNDDYLKNGSGLFDKQPDSVKASDAKEVSVSMSRGQRKRQAKKDQYLKKENMVLSSLRLARMEEQRGRLDGLDALKEALLPISFGSATAAGKEDGKGSTQGDDSDARASVTSKAVGPVVATNKAKKNLASRELAHMNLVLEHPAFQANPFEAIREHLKNSLSNQADMNQEESEARAKEIKSKDLQKRKARKDKAKAIKSSAGYKAKKKMQQKARRMQQSVDGAQMGGEGTRRR